MRPSGAIQMASYAAAGGGGGPVGLVQASAELSVFPSPTGLTWTIIPSTAFTAGNRVIFGVGIFEDTGANISTVASATVNGSAMTMDVYGSNNGDHYIGAIFSGIAGAGSAGIVLTLSGEVYSGSGIYAVGAYMERDDITGVDTSASFASAGHTNSMIGNTGSLASGSELIVTFGLTGNNDTVTVTGSDTFLFKDPDGANSLGAAMGYRNNSGTGNQAVTWAASIVTQWGMLVGCYTK